MGSKIRAHAIITGRVQGVFFRVETKYAAEGFGVIVAEYPFALFERLQVKRLRLVVATQEVVLLRQAVH